MGQEISGHFWDCPCAVTTAISGGTCIWTCVWTVMLFTCVISLKKHAHGALLSLVEEWGQQCQHFGELSFWHCSVWRGPDDWGQKTWRSMEQRGWRHKVSGGREGTLLWRSCTNSWIHSENGCIFSSLLWCKQSFSPALTRVIHQVIP